MSSVYLSSILVGLDVCLIVGRVLVGLNIGGAHGGLHDCGAHVGLVLGGALVGLVVGSAHVGLVILEARGINIVAPCARVAGQICDNR